MAVGRKSTHSSEVFAGNDQCVGWPSLMAIDRSKLSGLAENRQRRLAGRGRPSLDLTADEVKRQIRSRTRNENVPPRDRRRCALRVLRASYSIAFQVCVAKCQRMPSASPASIGLRNAVATACASSKLSGASRVALAQRPTQSTTCSMRETARPQRQTQRRPRTAPRPRPWHSQSPTARRFRRTPPRLRRRERQDLLPGRDAEPSRAIVVGESNSHWPKRTYPAQGWRAAVGRKSAQSSNDFRRK